MLLFRRLADEGRIVVVVTHKFEKFEEMHHVAILTPGGKLAFFGPPLQALEYFACDEPSDIYRRISNRDPNDVKNAFQRSPYYEQYVASRIAESAVARSTTGTATHAAHSPERKPGIRQWFTLTRRYLETKLTDVQNTVILLAQAPLIAVILALITSDTPNDAKTLFIAAVVAVWIGANNAIREIVSEVPIYRRERLSVLKIPSHVLSKFVVLGGIGLLQCLMFVGILVWWGRLESADFVMLTTILYMTALGGIAMGLFFSAVVKSTEKAMSLLPLLLIPQLLLSGFLKPVEPIYMVNGQVTSERRYQEQENALHQQAADPRRSPTVPAPSLLSKFEGLGAAQYAAALISARWSIDALAHAVSIEDAQARGRLPAQMTVIEYTRMIEGRASEDMESRYRQRVLLDLIVLSSFVAIFLALTMWAMKRKDAL
jgi:hypothetical protein